MILAVRPARKLVHIVAVRVNASIMAIPRCLWNTPKMRDGMRKEPMKNVPERWSWSPWIKYPRWEFMPSRIEYNTSFWAGMEAACSKRAVR
jgi:hypothetical protein